MNSIYSSIKAKRSKIMSNNYKILYYNLVLKLNVNRAMYNIMNSNKFYLSKRNSSLQLHSASLVCHVHKLHL